MGGKQECVQVNEPKPPVAQGWKPTSLQFTGPASCDALSPPMRYNRCRISNRDIHHNRMCTHD